MKTLTGPGTRREPGAHPTIAQQAPALRVAGLSKAFGDKLAVDRIDLVVPRGFRDTGTWVALQAGW